MSIFIRQIYKLINLNYLIYYCCFEIQSKSLTNYFAKYSIKALFDHKFISKLDVVIILLSFKFIFQTIYKSPINSMLFSII